MNDGMINDLFSENTRQHTLIIYCVLCTAKRRQGLIHVRLDSVEVEDTSYVIMTMTT